jgi:membrane fusion protein (multidrug efflux system)
MKRKYIYILLSLVVVAGISYWATREKKNDNPAAAGNPSGGGRGGSLTVDAIVVKPRAYANIITVSGTIEADEQVQIRSEISGIVRELPFQEGAWVQKGQLLIRMDDSELQAHLIQAQTREKLMADNEQRARLLLEKEAISSQEYDVAFADYESAKAQTTLIKAQLAKTRVLAPFAGKIGLRSVSVGEYLTPTTIVANLMSVGQVKIQFAIPEKYSGQIHPGHHLSFTSSNQDKEYVAKVYAVEPGVDETTRTIRIRAIADNQSGALVPGAFVRINLPLDEQENAMMVPTYAVIPVQDGKQVYLFKEGKSVLRNVQTESRTQFDVLVTEGLQPGDTVITSGIMSIRDGMAVGVRIVEQQQ